MLFDFWIPDSGFGIPDSGFWFPVLVNLDSGFRVFGLPLRNQILASLLFPRIVSDLITKKGHSLPFYIPED